MHRKQETTIMINRAASFGIGLAVVLSGFSAIAAPLSPARNLSRPTSPPPMPTELPELVARRIKLDLARRINVPVRRLSIYTSSVASWSNDCLELAYMNEDCQPKNIQGWNVFVRDGDTFYIWSYRTDRTGRRLRLDLGSQSRQSNFSTELSQQLLHTASEQLQQPISNLNIGSIQAITWDNECLALTEPGISCMQTTVPGFRAIVRNDSREWIYHLSADGSQIVRNVTASDSTGSVIVTFMNASSSTAPDLNSQTIFQNYYRDWAGDNKTTTALTADGQVTTTYTTFSSGEEISSWSEQSQISREEAAAFQMLLEQHNFSSFAQIQYHTDAPVAFGGTRIITGAGASVELFHSETWELPEDLQRIMEAWESITS